MDEGRFGNFRIDAKLGQGGMGEVWKAWDEKLGRWVALKLLKGGADDDRVRFLREAQTAAALVHPNIAAIYEVGAGAERPFIAMQLIDGGTLRARNPDPLTLAALLRDAARALAFAHARGIVHRDIKPENLMVDRADRLYVMDFGLARAVENVSGMTASGMMVGTPAYMSPEQARGERADERSDVYSLGATLYELLAGHPPFEGGDLLALVLRILEEEPPRLAGIDSDLESIALMCLEKDPRRRYATAAELGDDLDRRLRGEPVRARPASSVRRFMTWAGRRRALAAMAAVLVAVVLAAGILFSVDRAREARRLSNERDVTARREKALTRLNALWTTIMERKADLRQLRTPPDRAREELKAAVAGLDAYIAEWPVQPQGWFVRARGRLYLGELEKAEQDLRTALERSADFRPAWSLLGIVRVEAYSRRLSGSKRTKAARIAAAKPLLNAAMDAFGKGVRARTEYGRWGLTWSREDDVMERLADALQLWFGQGDRPAATQLLRDGIERYRAEEYARFLGILEPGTMADIDRCLEWAPGYVAALVDRSFLKIQDERFESALEDLDRALAVSPDCIDALVNRGITCWELRRPETALTDLGRAIALQPENGVAHNNRSWIRARLGDSTGAREDVEIAIRLDPGDPDFRLTRATQKQSEGDPAGAAADCDEAIRLAPAYARSYALRSAARLTLGDRSGAVTDAERAVELAPRDGECLYSRGCARQHQQEHKSAMADYDEAVRLGLKNPTCFTNRGLCRLKFGDVEGAAADSEASIRTDAMYAGGYALRGDVRCFQRRPDDARADYARALRIDPRCAQAFFGRAVLCHEEGDLDGALADYDKAIAARSDHAEALFNRGNLKRVRGDAAGAVADYTRAIELAPRILGAHLNLAIAHMMSDNHDRAVACLTRALELQPGFVEALLTRASALRVLGRTREARADIDRAIELRPGAPEPWLVRAQLRDATDREGIIADAEMALRKAPRDWPYRAATEDLLRGARQK